MEQRPRKSIAIVGGSGYIGRSIAEELSKAFDVTILDVVPPRKCDLPFRLCDIRDKAAIASSLNRSDLVINTAIIQLPRINEIKREAYEVNVLGLQNLCDAVEQSGTVKGLLHVSSWHVFGERGLNGVIDEGFGFGPDNVEERAKFYVLCKITQEGIVRANSEMSRKSYGIIRVGTVLGEGMSEETAVMRFIQSAVRGKPLTPYKHSQYRPMLLVDIHDVCKAARAYVRLALANGSIEPGVKIINLFWPHPITVIELARTVQRQFGLLGYRSKPRLTVIDKGIPSLCTNADRSRIRVDITRARELLGIRKLTSPEESIRLLLLNRLRDGGH